MKYQFKNAFDTIMIDRLTGIPEGAKILVCRLAFTAILLAEKYEVHFVTDDPEAKELFDQTVIGNGEFGNDDKSYLIDPSEEINKKENEKAWLEQTLIHLLTLRRLVSWALRVSVSAVQSICSSRLTESLLSER